MLQNQTRETTKENKEIVDTSQIMICVDKTYEELEADINNLVLPYLEQSGSNNSVIVSRIKRIDRKKKNTLPRITVIWYGGKPKGRKDSSGVFVTQSELRAGQLLSSVCKRT